MTKPERELQHTRQIICQGFKRSDGLWDIEASLSDTKTYPFTNMDRGEIKAGEPIHLMHLRLAVDLDLTIHEVESQMQETPFHFCKTANQSMASLVGLKIGPGWLREVRQRIGGTKGCTHLLELLGPLATTAFQTTFAAKSKKDDSTNNQNTPALLNSCHAFASDGPVVKVRWPEYYTGK